ncbi:TetR/AcrR family transcriptional regulator [Amycolatopsis sp. NPDC057786]|uniref:TetR/AcrR family transcriptional regulator n=1 Tax=Amycolatopsis sp. NPDC057786 TaxID=3346250 RepID=UPI003673422B
MTGRRRWSSDDILDAAGKLLAGGDAEAFSVRKLAAVLGTDSSSLYRHFRNKAELLRAVADRALLTAIEGYEPEGDWKQCVTDIAFRLRDVFARQPQIATVWGRFASGGTGSRAVLEALLQALRSSGLPDERIPAHCHRLAVLVTALIASDGGIGTLAAEDREHGMESFRVAVLGADPEQFPAVARFAREILPLGADRRDAYADILAAHLDQIEAEANASRRNSDISA